MNNEMLYSNSGHEKAHEKTQYAFCSSFHHFEIPDHLLDQLKKGNVVIFAGAGISTETSNAFRCTFYDEIRTELALNPKNKPPFSTLMSMYCKRPDGRRDLLEKLRSRFEYIAAFPELLRAATRFHQEISTLFHVDTFITTNWDDYFERYCGATPFVTAEDFAFWNVPGRKVFKIHGSVSNYGSIIATDEDFSTNSFDFASMPFLSASSSAMPWSAVPQYGTESSVIFIWQPDEPGLSLRRGGETFLPAG